MKYLVLGAGLQGSAAAWDLARSEGTESVLLVDREEGILREALESLPPAPRTIETRVADLEEGSQLAEILEGVDACLNALPYFLTLPVAEACADAGKHYVDLGGNTDIVLKILELDARAAASGACLVPDCGLAPGLAATASMAAIDGMDEVDSLQIRVGGLPQAPRPPLDYGIVFSVHGLLNEYLGEAVQLREGEILRLPTLDDVEPESFPAPLGRCESFSTLGGVSTLPWSLQGKVRNLAYKTLRYPGHAEKIRLLRDLGFLDEEARDLDGCPVSPRALAAELLKEHLLDPEMRDLVAFRVVAEGRAGDRRFRRRLEFMDLYDEETGISAMRRSTAFPASLVLQHLARGDAPRAGALRLEDALDPAAYLEELADHDLEVILSEEEL